VAGVSAGVAGGEGAGSAAGAGTVWASGAGGSGGSTGAVCGPSIAAWTDGRAIAADGMPPAVSGVPNSNSAAKTGALTGPILQACS
jgi:hypothetical protein